MSSEGSICVRVVGFHARHEKGHPHADDGDCAHHIAGFELTVRQLHTACGLYQKNVEPQINVHNAD